MRTAASAFAAATLFAAFATGCAADPSSDEQGEEAEVVSARITAKLYDEPNEQPNPSCDLHTALTVSKRGSKLTLTLENKLSATSTCEIAVQPNLRKYSVTEAESCGSKIYAGKSGGDDVSLMDNRTRICEDVRAAIFELTETVGGKTRVLYGNPQAAPPPLSKVLDVKLYLPDTKPSPSCDHYTKLVIGQEGNELRATLKNELSATSSCEIAVVPNERSYALTAKDDGCGTKVYTGTSGGTKLEVQDHRKRVCENVIPAAVEVHEGKVYLLGNP